MESISLNEKLLKILLVEDNPGDAYLIVELLKSAQKKFDVKISSRLSDAIKLSTEIEFDVILLDLGLPDSVGLETLRKFLSLKLKPPVIVMTGLDDEETALTSVKEGAQDYLVKNSLTSEIILRAIRYGIERKKLFKEVSTAKEALQKLNAELDQRIQERTRELAATNTLLHIELDEHKQTSEKLKESEEKYRLLFTRMIDGFALFEIILDDHKKPFDYRFISVNPAYETLTGLKAGKIMYRTARELWPDKNDLNIKTYGDVAMNGRSIEFENYDPDLNKYFKINTFCPQPGYCAVILQDITQQILIENDKKNAEEQLKKYAADLKELNATKDKFFGIIAHDLKNPFCGLMGASELLINYAEQFDRENIINISTLLNDSARQGHALLENLLEWSRSQSGKLDFNPENLDLKELIDENIANLKSHVVNKKISLSCKVTEMLEATADKNMLNTILRNLLSNAVKFTPKNGKVHIEAKKFQDHIMVSIKDTGIGISPNNIQKLFRIDVKYTREGTEQESGTGLGLLLCKEFVEKHGGNIWVESQVGKGSEFKFTIPVKNPVPAGEKIKSSVSYQV